MKISSFIGIGITGAMTAAGYGLVTRLDDKTVNNIVIIVVAIVLAMAMGGFMFLLVNYRVVPNNAPPAKRVIDTVWSDKLHEVEPHPALLQAPQAMLPPPPPQRPQASFMVLGEDLTMREAR